MLREQSKELRRSVYEVDEFMKENFPAKNTEDSVEKELEYCKELIDVIKKNEKISGYPKIHEKLNLLEETVCDDIEHLETSKDGDSKTGHKTADTSFFGYKTHIAMTEERIITAATVTSGEKTDGKELPALVRKSREAGMKVEAVIGDKAYSEKKNIEATKDGKNIKGTIQRGRWRWKIENEGFNIQKNHGYNLGHRYSHDYKGLKNHYLLIQIGHMISQVIESWRMIWNKVTQSREQKHKRLLESLKREQLKESQKEKTFSLYG